MLLEDKPWSKPGAAMQHPTEQYLKEEESRSAEFEHEGLVNFKVSLPRSEWLVLEDIVLGQNGVPTLDPEQRQLEELEMTPMEHGETLPNKPWLGLRGDRDDWDRMVMRAPKEWRVAAEKYHKEAVVMPFSVPRGNDFIRNR
jgi:hypothetical protein